MRRFTHLLAMAATVSAGTTYVGLVSNNQAGSQHSIVTMDAAGRIVHSGPVVNLGDDLIVTGTWRCDWFSTCYVGTLSNAAPNGKVYNVSLATGVASLMHVFPGAAVVGLEVAAGGGSIFAVLSGGSVNEVQQLTGTTAVKVTDFSSMPGIVVAGTSAWCLPSAAPGDQIVALVMQQRSGANNIVMLAAGRGGHIGGVVDNIHIQSPTGPSSLFCNTTYGLVGVTGTGAQPSLVAYQEDGSQSVVFTAPKAGPTVNELDTVAAWNNDASLLLAGLMNTGNGISSVWAANVTAPTSTFTTLDGYLAGLAAVHSAPTAGTLRGGWGR